MSIRKRGTSVSGGFRAGDRVQIRSRDEILATLDERGELESLPFMPEMLPFCGQTLTVEKVAAKACDTISKPSVGLRKMERAVHLTGLRCDGSAHGGCENACLFYWKDDWLKRPGEPTTASIVDPAHQLSVLDKMTRQGSAPDGAELFSCQATELNRATEALPFFELSQYVQDYRSGNASIGWIVRAFFVGIFNRVQNNSKRILPRRLWLRGGLRWGFLSGRVVGRTPLVDLNLQPGERVRVKSKKEIADTLNASLLNRGLGFDEEMSRFCGYETTVQRRVQQVIDESTGRMMTMKTACVVLDGVTCEGAYNSNCPRGWVCFWREAWLERVAEK